jgi:hypothetical protein
MIGVLVLEIVEIVEERARTCVLRLPSSSALFSPTLQGVPGMAPRNSSALSVICALSSSW